MAHLSLTSYPTFVMNRFFLLLGSSLLLAGSAQAQLGLRVGGSLTQLSTSQAEDSRSYDTRGSSISSGLGYQAGVLYVGKLGKRFALVPEVQLRRENAQVSAYDYSYVDAYRDWHYQLRLSYLSVPVLVRATLGPVYVEAGPQASMLLQARQVGTLTTSGWGTFTQDLDQSVTGDLHRFDIGPCLGVGVKLPAGLGLSVRAYQGLMALSREQRYLTVYPSPSTVQHRQSLEASLTYQLPARQ
jgi:hypothetical protein